MELKSSDGELFGAHLHQLQDASQGKFPVPTARGRAIVLPENAKVLGLLLALTHPCPPDVDTHNLDFCELYSLADAGARYGMQGVKNLCYHPMRYVHGEGAVTLIDISISSTCRTSISEHPLEVLRYAVIHELHDLREAAAPHTLGMHAPTVRKALKGRLDIFAAWVCVHI